MEHDAKLIRSKKPFEFVNCNTGVGVHRIAEHIINDLLFDRKPVEKLSHR